MHNFEKINPINQKARRYHPTYLDRSFANRFYIYNGGIHQIVRIGLVGFDGGLRLMIQKPSGKYTEFTTTIPYFNKRKVFDTFEDASVYLLSVWRNENKVPAFRQEYIKELESVYADQVFITSI